MAIGGKTQNKAEADLLTVLCTRVTMKEESQTKIGQTYQRVGQ